MVNPSGNVRDDASAKLRKLRIDISQARINIEQTIDRILKDRTVVKFLHTRRPPSTMTATCCRSRRSIARMPGIVHRSSDSGATLFVEPAAAVELNNRIISLKADEQAEINRLLWHLTHQVHLNQAEILRTMDALAVIDLIVAKVPIAQALFDGLPADFDRRRAADPAGPASIADRAGQACPREGRQAQRGAH